MTVGATLAALAVDPHQAHRPPGELPPLASISTRGTATGHLAGWWSIGTEGAALTVGATLAALAVDPHRGHRPPGELPALAVGFSVAVKLTAVEVVPLSYLPALPPQACKPFRYCLNHGPLIKLAGGCMILDSRA